MTPSRLPISASAMSRGIVVAVMNVIWARWRKDRTRR